MYAEQLRQTLDQMCNEAFDTPELRRYFPRPLTWPAQRVKTAMIRRYFEPTNRDCWAYAMAAAPMDVKRVIWKHEEEELIFDPRLGAPHVADDADRPDREHGKAASPDVIDPPPGVLVATFARRQFAKDSPWLAALAASHVIERLNDPTVIQGPALAQRGVNQMLEDLGVPPDQIPGRSRVHLDADVEHGAMTWSVFQHYVRDETTYAQALHGGSMGLACFRVYAGAVGDLMASVSQ